MRNDYANIALERASTPRHRLRWSSGTLVPVMLAFTGGASAACG